MRDSAVRVDNLTVSYDQENILENINLTIPAGVKVAIIGPNGAGKSTLLKAIVGLLPLNSGIVKINGQSIQKQRKNIAYLPQKQEIDWDFPISVLDLVLLGRYPHLGLFRWPKEKDYKIAKEALKDVGLLAYQDRQIAKLSGGQKQRAFLARALAQEAELIFLDEPFSGVDKTTENSIYDLLDKIRKEGKTIIVVNHDLKKAKEYFDYLILVNRKIIASGAAKQVFTPNNLEKAFSGGVAILDQGLVVLK